ncbi:hypothetical protein [Brevibacillus laterosporus]|uniref:Uncharacterized protein n=1 Tax=Brevibacillus laterosporus TaxID=1465 RepID=A0AAP8QCI5_BRELA|nr:hypothetical protein [Brevibacillus laterosporus]MED1665064.1 hypothetical protein [Brevibacillus laterosporus]MED1668725.1 hypothetical protein [Brevibacillus laterosporus]MED1716398.1 hypothetical protein [Brevibacillus laterosporus]PPA88557.1 hypothetical protein C4A76_07935 [Brevibacillus laterosporus]PPB01904.1 hypothetical protein C4A77_13870 [Brevibacillus laterosporus]
MEYIKRNADGTLGNVVETPGHQILLTEELISILEAIVQLDMQNVSSQETIKQLNDRILALEDEVKSIKAGEKKW